MSQLEFSLMRIIIDVCKALYIIFSQIKKKVLSSIKKMSSFKGILTLVLVLFVLVSIVQESHECSKGKLRVGKGGRGIKRM